MSAGLQHLDQLVEDSILGKSNVSLQGPVVILPAAPGVPSAAPAAALSTKASSKKPATSSKKTSKPKASADDTATKSSAKKPRSTKKLTASTLPSYDFAKLLEVNPNAPRVVRTAIAIVPHKPSKSPRGGRQPQGPIAEDLAVLHDKDQARYEATLENAHNPAKGDPYGYPQVLSFLEFTEALNPKAIAKNRLSMTALTRIRQDLTSGTKLKTSWITNQNAEPWKRSSATTGSSNANSTLWPKWLIERTNSLPSILQPRRNSTAKTGPTLRTQGTTMIKPHLPAQEQARQPKVITRTLTQKERTMMTKSTKRKKTEAIKATLRMSPSCDPTPFRPTRRALCPSKLLTPL
ncbi:hypothetical protein F442_21879 [Phytophthora nicotianae P10297]|uniref:Uncharacterized protein n=1 Tax=Phytophthora nicotianae P10297 TaxID=1317064 RepID=W2Y3Z4_PHYNI|nr:hypothetical protein F442_21879 [Phytophthora nicotianae P10297]